MDDLTQIWNRVGAVLGRLDDMGRELEALADTVDTLPHVDTMRDWLNVIQDQITALAAETYLQNVNPKDEEKTMGKEKTMDEEMMAVADRGPGVTRVIKEVYRTSDGKEFKTEAEAEAHQVWADFIDLVQAQVSMKGDGYAYCRECDGVGLTDIGLWRFLVDRREEINALLLRADEAERRAKKDQGEG